MYYINTTCKLGKVETSHTDATMLFVYVDYAELASIVYFPCYTFRQHFLNPSKAQQTAGM